MNVLLEDNGNSVEIDSFVYSRKRADIGDPNNTSFIMRIKTSVGFAGESQYVCDMGDLRRFMLEMDEVFKKRRLSAKLTDQVLGSNITFKIGRRSILYVSGMAIGEDGEHILRFQFSIERSNLFAFTKDLRMLIAEYCGTSAS